MRSTKVFKREGRSGIAVNGAEASPSHVGDLLRQDFGVEYLAALDQVTADAFGQAD